MTTFTTPVPFPHELFELLVPDPDGVGLRVLALTGSHHPTCMHQQPWGREGGGGREGGRGEGGGREGGGRGEGGREGGRGHRTAIYMYNVYTCVGSMYVGVVCLCAVIGG